MAVIRISYEEGSAPDNYEGVSISYDNLKKEKVFFSESFVKDWYDCVKFATQEIGDNEHIMMSSSVDHFLGDGAPFGSAYLAEVEEGKIDLVYDYVPGVLMFVPENTEPTWNELRELCGDPPKKK